MPCSTGDNLKYSVFAYNDLDDKLVAKTSTKSAAIAAAQEFVSVEVIRNGKYGAKTVYSHTHVVKPEHASAFSHNALLKKQYT